MLSEEQEMIWLCGSGEAFGAAAAAGDAFGLEFALNAIEKTRIMIAIGVNATAENRLAGFFMGDLTSMTWNRARALAEKRREEHSRMKMGVMLSDEKFTRQIKSENSV